MRELRHGAGALLAFVCAVAAGCAQPTSQDIATGTTESHPGGGPGTATPVCTHVQLRDQMRRLWTDHVAYTRFYIIEAIAGLPEAPITAQRLLANQDQIGDAIKPFYGDAAGDQLSQLLREHITGAAAVLQAAIAGDATALAAAKTAWYANADEIARFLASANPNIEVRAMIEMMHVHLDQTLAEATARLTGDWAGDVRDFDAIVAHILDMADALTDAIAAQFPDKISAATPDEGPHVAVRALWEDHVIWTRVVIIDAIAHGDQCTTTLPDLDVALARLLRNQEDIGNALRPVIGDANADQLIALLKGHITIAAELVLAAKAHDAAHVRDAASRWYANADQIAQLLAGVLHLPLADTQAMMKEHLDQTLAEATDHLAGDFQQDIADYDAIVGHILDMADAITAGVLATHM